MTDTALLARIDQTPKSRILQYRNRRYSIRLEPAFWQALEAMAERRGLRFGRFIGTLAEAYQGRNFASHLRALALLEQQRTLADHTLAASLGAAPEAPEGRPAALAVFLAAPAPGLLLSRSQVIMEANPAFLAWLGSSRHSLVGQALTGVIQVRSRPPLNSLWRQMIEEGLPQAHVQTLFVEPGRALAAPGILVGLPGADKADFHGLLWLNAERRKIAGP